MLYTFYFSFVADHYQYVASIGPIALAAAGMARAFSSFGKGKPFLRPALGGTLLLALGLLTWRQCGMYADLETLWRATIARNPIPFWLTSTSAVFFRQGHVDEAIAHFKTAWRPGPITSELPTTSATPCSKKGRWTRRWNNFKRPWHSNLTTPWLHNSLGDRSSSKGTGGSGHCPLPKSLGNHA